jgi:uncharacterized protein
LIFVDTGALLARYVRQDQHREAALRVWEEISKGKLWILTSNFVLDEFATLLARRSDYAFAATVLRSLYSSEVLEILRPSREHEVLALDLFEKFSDQRVSFTDCVSFALMRSHRIEKAFTFDRHFQLAGFTALPSPA